MAEFIIAASMRAESDIAEAALFFPMGLDAGALVDASAKADVDAHEEGEGRPDHAFGTVRERADDV